MSIDPEDLSPELRERIVPKNVTKQDALDALAALQHKVEKTHTEMSVADAERTLEEARRAETRKRVEQEKMLPREPAIIGDTVYMRLSEVPAYDLGTPSCDFVDPRYTSLGRCTKPRNHLGEHGQPNWTGRVEVEASRGSVSVETRHSHGGSSVHFRSYDEYKAFMADVDELVREGFAKMNPEDD